MPGRNVHINDGLLWPAFVCGLLAASSEVRLSKLPYENPLPELALELPAPSPMLIFLRLGMAMLEDMIAVQQRQCRRPRKVIRGRKIAKECWGKRGVVRLAVTASTGEDDWKLELMQPMNSVNRAFPPDDPYQGLRV